MISIRSVLTSGLVTLLALPAAHALTAEEEAMIRAALGPKVPIYADISAATKKREPRTVPPRTVYDDCILKNMAGVANDAAARSVRQACEGKQKQFVAETRSKYDQQYGQVADDAVLEVTKVESRDGMTRISLRNGDQGTKKIVTYARVLVGGHAVLGEGCRGFYEIFSILANIAPGGTVVAEVQPKALGKGAEPCVEVLAARVKEPAWSDSLKAAATSRVKPMQDDFLEAYEGSR
ncbi:hypothetical protein ACO2Q9_09760 [Variovorax sp. VNK109]|uniref:hypothetical protein n=1 Tax=Variovorax sp. VNK109 TaxID=3400919 RepID=UPI003C01E350